MGAERRLENKRMKVAKRMEVSCLETGTSFLGETEDVSDSGIRAYLDRSPRTGAGVMVKLFWDEEKPPVETFGRVAWSTPLPAGTGIEVGLMLGAEGDVYGNKEPPKKRAATRYHKFKPTNTRQYIPFREDWRAYDDDSIENKKTLAAIAAPETKPVPAAPEPIILVTGESFKVLFQGKETWARIANTDDIDGTGNIRLSLQLKDKRLWKRKVTKDHPPAAALTNNEENDEFNPEEWKAKPLSNAYQTVKCVIGPILLILARISFVIGRLLLAFGRFAWRKLPLAARAKAIELLDNVRRHRITGEVHKVVYKAVYKAVRITQNTSTRLKTIIAR